MKYGRTDDNQKQIVSELRKRGVSVFSMADLGKGIPDICVGYRGVTYLFEVKNGSKPPSQRKLTPLEKEFMHNWKGCYAVVCSLHEILYYIN